MEGFDVGGGAMQATEKAYQLNQRRTYAQRVSDSIKETEEALKDLKRMQEIFAAHPEFEELLSLVQRGRV